MGTGCRLPFASDTDAHLPQRGAAGDEFEKTLTVGIASLLRIHSDADLAMWAVAEESLWYVLRALLADPLYAERVLVDLFKGIRTAEREKSRRVALARFCDVCHLLQPARCRRFITALLPVILALIAECSEAMLESFSQSAHKLFGVFACYMKVRQASSAADSFGTAP
jgi:hypothetical protein